MSALSIAGGIFLVVGFIVNIVCLLRYSSFMDRVNRVDPGLAKDLLFDGGEGGERNMFVTQYFCQSKFMELSDPSMREAGARVRNSGFASLVLVAIGIFLLVLTS